MNEVKVDVEVKKSPTLEIHAGVLGEPRLGDYYTKTESDERFVSKEDHEVDIKSLSDKIETKADISDLQEEIEARTTADSELSDRIEDNKTNIENLVSRITTNEQNIVTLDENKAERSELQAEITNRENADIELSDKIDIVEDDLTEDIDALTTIVENNYTTLDNRITEVASELEQSIEENVVALQQEDTALQNQINTHSQTLTSHDARITSNATAISQETTARQDADNDLQEQIDGITAGSDVKDIVGTYAELQAYDKTKLGDNDIIKVLQDETKENASTYYRYVISSQSFTYIGKEGPFYTKSEADTLLNAKQNTIDDLVTIRNNASDGKGASDTISSYGDIVTHNANEFATTQGLATKQDTLVSGTNIKTINNQSLLGSGNIDIQGGGASSFSQLEGSPYDNDSLKNALDGKQDNLDIILLSGAIINE